MSEDISRNTFNRIKDFSLVRMQQGRLLSDADWNEQGDILRASDRETAADIVGPSGFPQDNPGFTLSYDAGADVLLIGPGVGYVAGIRHELRPGAPLTLAAQSGGSSTLWRIEEGGVLADGDTLADDANGTLHKVQDFETAEDGTRSFNTTPNLPSGTVAVHRVSSVSRQPYTPSEDLPGDTGDYLAYLKSLDIPVTALDDSSIREVAFDGPDTATRDRTIWQVLLVRRDALLDRGFSAAELECPALAMRFDPVLHGHPAGSLRARAEVGAVSAGPCTLPPSAGYRSLENQLYRVEIHNGGDEGRATYKWSRENAIHRTRYRSIDAGVLVVDNIGRDDRSALKPEDWVEIRDQDSLWAETPGFFARIGEVTGKRISLTEILDPESLVPLTDAGGQPDIAKLPPAAFVTRWEGGAPQPLAPAVDSWSDLENGVQVAFGSGEFQNGDYWTVPARAVTGDVEWPAHPVSGEPLDQAAEGPRRDYAALAFLERTNSGWSLQEDCRRLFPAAVDSKQFLYCSGDGQEVMPDPLAPANRLPLPQALKVAVVRGHTALAGERVLFEVVQGDGRFGNGLNREETQTGSDGTATVNWSLDAVTFAQQVRATRLDAAGGETHTAILFNATLSRADQTSYDPANTPELAGANSVQKAIEALVGLQQIGCTTYIITPEQDWVAVLEGLKPGENASICFARGTYKAVRTVKMTGLGDIRISGTGAGISVLTVDRVEAALCFEDCRSVTLSDMSVAAPAAVSGIDEKSRKGRRGTVDFSHCDEVKVQDCAISCGAGTSPSRACVSTRGYSKALGDNRPAKTVTITGNSFSVGHMQEAVLVTDAIDVSVSDNRIAVKPRKGALPLESFISDKTWLANTVNNLVARPVKGKSLSKEDDKLIRAKEWRYGFRSPVPQDTWDKLVEEDPPTKVDLSSQKRFTSYADGLIAKAAKDADAFPSLKVQIDGLRAGLGPESGKLDDPKILRNLLVTSKPATYRFDARKGDARDVLLEANNAVLAFDSAFSNRDWNLALGRSDTSRIANSDQLLAHVKNLAKRLLEDKAFRDGLGSVENWIKKLNEDSPSLAWQGIVCAGRVLGNVAVKANVIRDCHVGIRVAPSHKQDQKHEAKSVLIEDNQMELLAQGKDFYAGYGLFVGNVKTLRILANEMVLSSRPNFRHFYAQGIRIWGFIGRYVLISQNRISMATLGVRIQHVEGELMAEREQQDDYLWVYSDNLVEGPDGTHDLKAMGLGFMKRDGVNRLYQGL